MDTDLYGPSLPPRFTQSVQSDHGSKHSDLQYHHSDPQSKHSEQPKRVASAYLSKSVAHILQRELYTMGNSGLLGCEAEMTLLQPHLGDSRRQELRNSPFWPTPLFKSQSVKDREDFLLKKGTPKDSQGFGPYQNKPFCDPHHNKKRGSHSSNQSFSSGRGKLNNRGFRGRFRPHSRG